MDDGSGLVTMVPAWMLDPVGCVGMKIGEPRVSVAALRELHYRLVERGLRRDSSNDSTVVQEECDEFDVHDHSTAVSGAVGGTAPGQPSVHLSPAIRDGFVAEGTSTELLGQSADVGCGLRRAGGQR